MSRTNRNDFALLGLLAIEPRSGYDVKQVVEEQLAHFWSESYGNIYPGLRRLTDRGWAEKRSIEREGGPTRHEYHLTEDGWSALTDWFADPVEPPRPKNELLLRLYFGRFAEPAQLGERVAEQRAEFEQRRDLLRSVMDRLEAADEPDVYLQMTVSYGLHALNALLDWSDEALERIAHLPSERDR